MSELLCEYCSRRFAQAQNLKKHYERCKTRPLRLLEQELMTLKKQFQNQREQYENQIQLQREQYENQIQLQKEQYEAQYHFQREQYEIRIQLQCDRIQRLEDHIFVIAKQPKENHIHNNHHHLTTHNQLNQKTLIVQHLAPLTLTREKVIAELESRDGEAMFRGGVSAFREFVIELLHDTDTGKPMIMCTDAARRMFIYIDEFGEIQKDVGMQKVHTILSGPLKDFAIREYIHLKKLYPDQADGLYRLLKQIEFQFHDINRFADNEFKNFFEKSKFLISSNS